MPSRKNRQVETRLVSEYLVERYPKFTCLQKVPLGSIDDKLSATEGYQRAINLSRPFRPEVDAIVVLPRYLVLVEAKVWQIVNGLGKIPLYASLVSTTPELKQYQPREVLMELVVGWTNPNLETMARSAGVVVRVYCPDWLQSVVNDQHRYWTAEYRRKREETMRLRRALDLE